jgi:putative phosphoesterase
MKRIGLLSDTHGFLDPDIFEHFAECDEIWHAGDVGSEKIMEQLATFKTFRGVFGNIDDRSITSILPRDLRFELEGLDIFITHIGGYPGRYNKRVLQIMNIDPPGLFICGHSHILKVIYDKKYQCLHMNPGACGHQGFHKIRTLLRFEIEGGRVQNAVVIELGLRGTLRS